MMIAGDSCIPLLTPERLEVMEVIRSVNGASVLVGYPARGFSQADLPMQAVAYISIPPELAEGYAAALVDKGKLQVTIQINGV